MTNLLARLNTYQSLNSATAEKKKFGQGVYYNFGEDSEIYKNGTFKKVIDAVIEQALASEETEYKAIASNVTNTLAQQGQGNLEIRVYNPKSDEYTRNVNNERSTAMGLDDKVKDYIVERDITNGEETSKVDYLDIVVVLNSAVGGI